MGLSVALSNALSGMSVGQKSLDTLSRNVANAGTPGYHRQSLNVLERVGGGTYVSAGALNRAFSASLQAHYNTEVSDSSYADTRASSLDRLQISFGKPGQAGSLDTAFNNFQTGLSKLATGTDNAATRAEVVANATTLASTLNRLSSEVQALRQEADTELGNGVNDLNRTLQSLETVNLRLADVSGDEASRASLMDQRDRLVADVAGMIDVNVDYRSNGTISIMTRSGISVLDNKAAVFSYSGVGQISAASEYNADPSKNGVGSLTLRSPSGLQVDLVAEDVVRSGRIGALVELRDTTLVEAQGQLDEIASSLAQAMSTIETSGTAAASGGASGFDIDIGSLRAGNEIEINYRAGNSTKTLRVVRVDDPTQLPMDYTDGTGARVVGLSFSGGAAGVAAGISTYLGPSFAVSNPSGSTVRILDDGAVNGTDVRGVTSRGTVASEQGAGLALSLFTESNGTDFTNRAGDPPQRTGFAARIRVNPDVLADNRLLVQSTVGASLGDASRAEYLRDRLDTVRFTANAQTSTASGSFRLSGTVGDMVNQAVNYQGSSAAAAAADTETRRMTMEALNQRMDDAYGVDIDEEMARLLELQNAFAANARVVSTVQQLIDTLLQM